MEVKSPRWPRLTNDCGVFITLTLVLILSTVAIYYPVHRLPFISMNDGEYVIYNFHIQQGLHWSVVKWAFSSVYAANWHPLTWLSHALDYQLSGLDSSGHHESNLFFHVLNAVLLFWVLWRATACLGRSFGVACLFALHPINVESVAWVAERKNLLSMFFLLLAMGVYRWYVSQPCTFRYLVVTLLFVLGLMSKPQVVTLPFVLLLWDYWPLRRVRTASNSNLNSGLGEIFPTKSPSWLLLEKVPFLGLSVLSAVITVSAQRAGGAMSGAIRTYTLAARLENAVVSYATYLRDAFWPMYLAIFYPHPSGRQSALWQALLLAIVTIMVTLGHHHRYLVTGWLWFLGTLVPMIGLIQVGGQAMADRYAYLPFVGLFIMVCWGGADLARHWQIPRIWVGASGIAALCLLAIGTHYQLTYWADDVALWSHAVKVTKDSSGAENMLGEALQKKGLLEDAMPHFHAAIAMDPALPYPHYHIGIYEQKRGDIRGAIEQFQRVIALTQSDTGLLAGLRADTFLRMYAAYEALDDVTDSRECLTLATAEKRKQRNFGY
jgi:tetratricopeptide (TPR) repeat protein